MDTTYIKVGGEIFNWPPLRACSNTARLLWISLYISQRRVLPGLFVAGLPAVADIAKMTPDDTVVGLDELIAERDLVEYDRDREVLRFTEFPDRCERPQNGRHIRSLWTRFRAVPNCQVRDAHVRTLEWLINDPTRAPTPDHIEAWSQTFGTISVPVHRRRGVRRLLDSDTSTSVQPSLFTNPVQTLAIAPNSIPYAIPYSDTHRSTINDLRSSSDSGESISRASTEQQEQIPPRTRLELVPPPPAPELPFAVTDMLGALAEGSDGRFSAGPIDDRLLDALRSAIGQCAREGVALDELRTVGRFLGAGGLAYRSDLGPVWLAKPGNLLDAVGQTRSWVARGERPIVGTGRTLRSVEPAPASAFTTGRKTL